MLELSQGTYHPCTCTDKFSCLTVWSPEFKYKLTHSKIVSRIGFLLDMTSKIEIGLSILLATLVTLLLLCPKTISIRWLAKWENAGVKIYRFNRLRFLNRWRIWLHLRPISCYAFISLQSPSTSPHMTTSWSRSRLRHLQYCGDVIMKLKC